LSVSIRCTEEASAKPKQSTINKGVSHMKISHAVQNIQRAETLSKFKDEQDKKQHFEDYSKAKTKEEKLKLFHSAIAEGWVSA